MDSVWSPSSYCTGSSGYSGTRPSSSIYTDSFHSKSSPYSEIFPLENVLKQISEQTLEQEEHTRHALYDEMMVLEHRLHVVQSAWETFCEAMELGHRITVAFNYGQQRMDVAKYRWLANCTAF